MAAYSGLAARHLAWALLCRAALQAGLSQARWRAPTLTSGRNQRRQIEQGFLRVLAMVIHCHRSLGFSYALAGSLLASSGGSILVSAEGLAESSR